MKIKISLVVFSLMLALLISILSGSQVKTASAEPASCVPGPHHGNITTSETWCLADSPHLFENTTTDFGGVTLTIEPGVRVEFTSGGNIGVAGGLQANGDADHPITFTSDQLSPGPGNWQGILAVAGSTLEMSYVDLAYAGQSGFTFGALAIYTSKATVSHSHIHHNLGIGVFLDNSGITPQFNDLEIDHNTTVGLDQNNISMNPSYQNIRLHDNDWDGLFIAGGNTDRDVNLDGSTAAFNGTPIYISNSVKVLEETTLTVTPGTTLMVNGGIAVPSTASLVVEGTQAAPVIFTSWEDVPQAGDWAGISASFGATLQMSYCELAYAGREGFDFGSLTIRTSDATVSHCRIHDGKGTALFLDNPGITPQFNDVEIDHYAGVSIVQNKISMNPSFVNMRLHDNTVDGLQFPYPGDTDRDVILDGSPAALNGAPIYMNYGFTVGAGTTLTITPGTILKSIEGISVATGATLVAEGTPAAPILFSTLVDPPVPGSWGGINASSGSTLRLSYCELAYTGRLGGALGAVYIATADAIVRQCRIHHSSGHGIYIKSATPFPLWNNVLTDNGGVALHVEGSGHLEALHTTLARNQVGIFVPNGSAVLTNTILANNAIGAQQANSGSISLTHTLFQDNTTPILGTVSDTNHIDGSAAFEADGYHLSGMSDAIDSAGNAGVSHDIDGDPRPIEAAPDLGADEYGDATALISAESGGTLTYTDTQGNPTEVVVPPEAVSQETALVLEVIDTVTPPFSYRQTGHAFHLDGYQSDLLVPSLVLDHPVRITLHYSDADVMGLDRKSFSLWYWDGSAWADAACGPYEHHPAQNWLSVPVCHLSQFSFFGRPYWNTLPYIRWN